MFVALETLPWIILRRERSMRHSLGCVRTIKYVGEMIKLISNIGHLILIVSFRDVGHSKLVHEFDLFVVVLFSFGELISGFKSLSDQIIQLEINQLYLALFDV